MKFSGSLSEADKRKAVCEIIGIPFDGNAFKKGARKGPKMIRKASRRLESFLWHKKLELSNIPFYDHGDIEVGRLRRGGYEQLCNKIEEKEMDIRKRKIFIGGDHSISFLIVKFLATNVDSMEVISIDAHADFRDIYKGKKFSNACVMRRIAELIGFDNIIEIGVRSSSDEEHAFFTDKIRIYDYDAYIGKNRNKNTYLSIDIDVLDPCIAPGVENLEPCGMSLESLISLIRGIMEKRDVIGCDVMEVNPKMDIANGITSLNAAHIIFEILCCYLRKVKEF